MPSIHNLSVPADRFTHAINNGAAHMRPLFVAARDAGIGLCLVPQGHHAFDVPVDRPTVLLVGDDMHEAFGPDGFHRKSVRRFIRRCRSAVIVSCAPIVTAYAAAATTAAMGMDTILIETRLEHEQNWRALIEKERPGISMLVATVQPEGGIH